MSENQNRRLKTNLINQYIYVRDTLPAYDKKCPVSKKYFELQRKTVKNGIVEELVEVDYPITKDSVNSHIDTSDYRNNPVQAVLNGTARTNLGDITDIQEFIANNPQEALSIYKKVAEELSTVDLAALEKSEEQKSEVKNNE